MKTTLIGTCFLILTCGFSTTRSSAFDITDVTNLGNKDKAVQADLQLVQSQEDEAHADEGGPCDFFPLDPVPAIGLAHNYGAGWQQLRLAGFSPAAERLGISQEKQQAIHAQYRDAVKKARELEEAFKKRPANSTTAL